MVLESMGEALRSTLKKIANAPFIDANAIKELTRDIQRALLQADVNVKLVLTLTKKIEQRALSEKPPAGMDSRVHLVRIVNDEVTALLGPQHEVPLKKQTIMMVGLYGQGKTTSCGKLAKYFQRKGLRPAFIACDVHRPAAYDQLKQIAEANRVPIFGMPGEVDPVKIVKQGMLEHRNADVIIVDTSGRHKMDVDLIEEMKRIFDEVKPDEKFLVLDAAVGQQAGPQAKVFHESIGITGVILTKLDGTARGGGALSAVAETGAPIVFIGVGEKVDDLEKFDPSRFVSRLLGMGDLQTLLEKAQEVAGEDAEKTAKKMMSGKFTLNDMYEQMEMLSGMGPLKKIAEMLPFGMSGKLKDDDMEATQVR
ncbi:MAG: signal recognition particle receptor subunit alpha, partial [Candidatus Thermoplasmatota archaeon]|nr:signal recognition particle receptor subunit alpha [Candidatus Thermoplasmatota archaeon]